VSRVGALSLIHVWLIVVYSQGLPVDLSLYRLLANLKEQSGVAFHCKLCFIDLLSYVCLLVCLLVHGRLYLKFGFCYYQ